MLAVTALSFLVLIHQSVGMTDLTKLLKAHPTWSFEVENVETVLENSARHLRGSSAHLATAKLRSKIQATLGPKITHIVKKVGDLNWPDDIPETFDAREKWPGCAALIEDVTDEGACPNDGPAIVASVISDKFCIHSNETYKEKLSAEYLVGCTESCKDRPQISKSFNRALMKGIPTGGSYNSNQGCLPYTQEPCKHTQDSYKKMKGANDKTVCNKDAAFEHKCATECSNVAYPKPLIQDKKTLESWYSMDANKHFIMSDIMTYGSTVISILLHDDFFKCPTGVYKPGPGAKYLNRVKFVKLIGWGEENNTKYWLAVNSWDKWCTSKVFKLARGADENFILAATASFEPFRIQPKDDSAE